jgi:hypothetical protein
MQVDPAIASLRSHRAPQPCVDAALALWQRCEPAAGVLADLAAYGAGAALDDLAALSAVVNDCGPAHALVQGLIVPVMEALRAEPLAQLPFGTSAMPGLARIRLAASGRAALTLAAFAPRPPAPARSVLFEDGEAHEIVLAGSASAALYRLSGDAIAATCIACHPATRMIRKDGRSARHILAVAQPLLVLQLTREAAAPGPAHEHALPGGALLKTISGSKRASQQMMALAVLGALEHRPALAAMEHLACNRSAERDLRWEALRQVLGLDTAAGMALLVRLAGQSDDALAGPAARLRCDLLAAQPALAMLEPA